MFLFFFCAFCLQLFEQINDGSEDGNTLRAHDFIPPRLLQSVSLEPKYPTFGTNDGYCLRTDFQGCITTTTVGEVLTEGGNVNLFNVIHIKTFLEHIGFIKKEELF